MADTALDTMHAVALTGGDRASGSGIVLAGDRSREFRRARVHSMAVRVLRVGLPVACFGIAVVYVWTMLQTAGYGSAAVAPTIQATLDKEITMDNPRYEGFTKDGGTYTITAKTALPDFKVPSLVKLNDITGVIFDARKARTDLTAAHGLFDGRLNRLDLDGGIDVVTETGMRARLETATLMTKEGTLTSQTPVRVEMPTGTVTSNHLALNQKTRDVSFEDQVTAHLLPQSKAAAGGEPAAVPVAGAKPAVATPFGHSNAPVDVTSARLDVHDASKSARFSGLVRAVQSAATLETEALDITYEGSAASTTAKSDPASGQTRIRRIVAPGAVVLTQATGERIVGDRADFMAAEEDAIVIGSVVINAGPDRHATCDRAEFRGKADTIELTGNVIVVQGRNELRGRILTVDRKAGQTVLASPADASSPKSRIFARLYQGDGKPGATAKQALVKEASAQATAAVPALGIATFKTDPNAPVDIEADRLTSEDAKKIAVFTGDVRAAQGDFVIRTTELHAAYSGDTGVANLAAQPVGGPAKQPAQLTRIEAKGKVVVTSKVGQEVTGDTAVFDLKSNTVLVSGKEVILTQDKNIVRCNKLKIDMTSGESNCLWEAIAAGGAASVAQAVSGAVITTPATGDKRSRPSILFYPQDHQKPGVTAKASPAAPIAARPATSSWESTVAPDAH